MHGSRRVSGEKWAQVTQIIMKWCTYSRTLSFFAISCKGDISPFRATQPDASPNQDPTRPPSADGSLSDPAPVSDPLWNTGNPHSRYGGAFSLPLFSLYCLFSYTSAMMSPIMNEMLSTDEGTDDEKARLLPDRCSSNHRINHSLEILAQFI